MDQLRGDLLRSYMPAFTGGFRRLTGEGYWVRRGEVNFALTLSFPGHAALATGMEPSHHGLTANEWWVNRGADWNEVDVSDDSRYHIVGSPADRMGASPKNLLAITLGEWVLQADPLSKSIALGTGTRIPIAYAGHHATAALWFDSTLNAFTTSTFYASTMPAWAQSFNRDGLAKFQGRVWDSTIPPETAKLADATPAMFHGHRQPSFPHEYDREAAQPNGARRPYPSWFSGTPLKDEALFALAATAVDAEQLGQRGALDYLSIDVDATDSVGHEYGPRSLEQLDCLLRLDRALGGFLDHLDRTLGKGNYLVALSADHGVADAPGSTPGSRAVTMPEIEALLDRVEALAKSKSSLGENAVRSAMVAELKKAPFIADAYGEARLASPSSDLFVHLYSRVMRPGFTTDFPLWTDKRRDYHPARYGIVVRFQPGMVLDAAVGVHGSPYSYDRDVPIIFFGSGIVPGTRERGARTVDVAPTLAAAAGLTPPAKLDGHALPYVLRSRSRAANRE